MWGRRRVEVGGVKLLGGDLPGGKAEVVEEETVVAVDTTGKQICI